MDAASVAALGTLVWGRLDELEREAPKPVFASRRNCLVWQLAVCFEIFDDAYRQRDWKRVAGEGGGKTIATTQP